ncbi:ABC transporter ATP-binding protein [Erythrobacter sp. BLCC-B19]|uniref:ABC transporter ATP-binding protein n=1 Tax=Erythrobacter sp. BLCC-B19 TaxID=3025315 RepID=UPI00235F43FD|nr:ABC transporter ATP-binding protein [Erythrobacter sp. BLCC-B19]WDA41311.1 ABC transporter ATP-binding protein [Erythrobacter sp. BLCC-B19]
MTPLAITGLSILRRSDRRVLIESLDCTVNPGEIVGLVGQSGSGKSLTALAATGLLPDGLEQVAGTIEVMGTAIAGLGVKALRDLRRHNISLIFQDPMTALSPTRSIGAQMRDVLAVAGVPRSERLARAAALLGDMDLPDPPALMRRFPHQLSGGQRQRVLIAMAFAGSPAVVLADEVTTALDVSVRAQVLSLLVDRARRTGSGLLLITHDLGAARSCCDRVLVMSAGRVVESGPTDAVFARPASAEARQLLASLPERALPRQLLPVAGDEP